MAAAEAPALLRGSDRRGSAPTRVGPGWAWTIGAMTLGVVVLVALVAPGGGLATGGLAWLLFVGSSVHVASTGWLYTLPDVKAHVRSHRLRYLWVPLLLVVGGALTCATLDARQRSLLLLAFFAWQFFHFAKQSLGMAALAASGTGASGLRPVERRCIVAAGLCGIVGLACRPQLLQLPLAAQLGFVFRGAEVAFAVAVAIGLLALARRPAPRRAGFELCAVAALVFSAPVFLFDSPYAAVGGMTAAHGLQYLLLVGLVAEGERRRTGRWAGMAVLVGMALMGGALLAAASHLHHGPAAARLIFGAYLGVVAAHFVVDGGLWRLREQFPRAFLSARLPFLVAPVPHDRLAMDREPI